MRIYRTDQFSLPLPDGHRFPAEKYQRLADAVAGFASHAMESAGGHGLGTTTSPCGRLCCAGDGWQPATRAWREIGLPWSPQLVERSRRSVGATIAAARSALLDGCGVNLAGEPTMPITTRAVDFAYSTMLP
jgi:acetoin utilization deacetylase AcuC-like enzyme